MVVIEPDCTNVLSSSIRIGTCDDADDEVSSDGLCINVVSFRFFDH